MQKQLILFQKIMTLFIAIGEVWGMMMMFIDPTGKMWGLDQALELLRVKMPWPDIFFRNVMPSGIVLFFVNGATQFVAAYLLFQQHRLAQLAVLACSIILMLWISVEWWVWDFNAICNTYFLFGLIEAISAIIGLKKK